MKELVVISGKGGTGKTSIVASFAALAEDKVMADCDVDAADMHLILNPSVKIEEDFEGGKEAILDRGKCTECGRCMEVCRYDAISLTDEKHEIEAINCEGCGVCAYFCPYEAIEMKTKIAGKWFLSDTRHGPLVHAKLGIAEDNSGKLVAKVREEAKKSAEQNEYKLIIIDGPPGIGCPVIASITGTGLVLIVTEPTVSGFHDLERVSELADHFRINKMICINKYDLNSDMTKKIEEFSSSHNIEVAAKIPYDNNFTKAQIKGKSLIEYCNGNTSKSIEDMWEIIYEKIK
ncbi:4Fe-4S binding protein [Spirochaetota bacterium]